MTSKPLLLPEHTLSQRNADCPIRSAIETPAGSLILHSFCAPSLVASLKADSGLHAFQREHQLLLGIAERSDCVLTLAYTSSGEIVGQVTLAPLDHWWQGIGNAYEIAVEVSTGWRRMGIARHLLSLAKSLAALDVLSGGHLIAGVGPGSSPQDYALVGIAFEERWKRFDEAIQLLRRLLKQDMPPFSGQFYAEASTPLEPFPAQEPGVPIWIGSWGSEAGLRRVARLGDGWLASAYHVTPASFAEALARLHLSLQQVGREKAGFPHALGSMFYYVTEDRRLAEELLVEVVSPALGRPVELLRERLPIGTPAECAEKLHKLQAAGVERIFLWPIADEVSQLARFHEQVLPQLPR
jgi:hypothetical protein